eukprot:NODE_951_length_1356_cov_72.061209_g792_i0.p5 GENE.NODE_951_length_1356_cov_72.061209_g792_i0~~NODE_951_length_1356_cov_72.061209_g792_i0.p5  ORF type:complete len:66 (+),score=3.55 NODE_951_length_1356_cov_72.061209_g792_i0:1088-1285(+)
MMPKVNVAEAVRLSEHQHQKCLKSPLFLTQSVEIFYGWFRNTIIFQEMNFGTRTQQKTQKSDTTI